MTAKTFFRIDHGCACMRGETVLILRLRKKGVKVDLICITVVQNLTDFRDNWLTFLTSHEIVNHNLLTFPFSQKNHNQIKSNQIKSNQIKSDF